MCNLLVSTGGGGGSQMVVGWSGNSWVGVPARLGVPGRGSWLRSVPLVPRWLRSWVPAWLRGVPRRLGSRLGIPVGVPVVGSMIVLRLWVVQRGVVTVGVRRAGSRIHSGRESSRFLVLRSSNSNGGQGQNSDLQSGKKTAYS